MWATDVSSRTSALARNWEGNMKLPHRRQFLHLAAGAVTLPAISRIATAQPSGVATNKTRVVTLGTRSGPTADLHRAQSSNVLITNGVAYVVDAGDGVSRRLIRSGVNFRDIANVFITHPHSDHTAGLGALMMWLYDRGNPTKVVGIYGPPGTAASVEGLLQFVNVNAEIRISDGTKTILATKLFSSKDADEGLVFQDANVKVTAVENTHFHFPPGSPGYGKYRSYSYRFDTGDRSVVFTGDTGPSDAVAELAEGADLLISEATNPVDEFTTEQIKAGFWQRMRPEEQKNLIRHHIEEHLLPEDLGKMAARANVKTVVMTHLQPSPNDDYSRYIAEVKKHYSGQILVAKDLMEF
jgi:ribonuclease BN (tRNA processing enzyme)